MFDPECLKDRRTPGEPDSFSDKPHVEVHAQKARVKHPPLQPGQDPLEHTPSSKLRLVGVLLWTSLRSRPDIAWVCCKDYTRLASSDEEARARVCVSSRRVAQYLRWTVCTLLCSMNLSRILNGIRYTDARWAPEGDYSHQAVAIYLGSNLVAWQSQRQSPVAPSIAQAELIASVWRKRLALSLHGQLNVDDPIQASRHHLLRQMRLWSSLCNSSQPASLEQDASPCEHRGSTT